MAGLIDYKCPSCGGTLEFDSASQKLKCSYCDSLFDPELFLSKDDSLNDNHSVNVDMPSSTWSSTESEQFGIYRCNSCGAEIIADATTASTSCPYCNNNIILIGRLAGELKPDCIIPFKLNKEQAKEALKNHLHGKALLPKVFSNENHLDEIKGLYVPYWLYDIETQADVRYKATKVRMWSDRDYNYTETSHFMLGRNGSMGFSNVPADASESIADELTESIEAFDYSELTDFKTAYLSGYFADRYDVSSENALERIKERIRASILDKIDGTVSGYDSSSRSSENVAFKNIRVKYAFLPVWILSTSWRGKQYLFAMNGQTGKFVGNLPIDKGIYWKYRLLYAAGIGAALFGLSYLLQLI